jgi:ketosteroid isomerase-like protein
MAKWLVAAAVALLFLSPGDARCDESASLGSATAESAVEARSRAWIKTEVDGDADAFRTFATDGYIQLYVEPKTPLHPARWASKTREQWAEEIRTKQVKYHSVVLRNTKVRLNGDIAFFTGEYTEKGVRDGAEYTESGFFAETWAKRNGQWFAVSSFFP